MAASVSQRTYTSNANLYGYEHEIYFEHVMLMSMF